MYLGLDLGTSGLKGLLIDDEQNVRASASASLTVERPTEGWSQQDPASWIAAAETVLAQLDKNVGLSGLRGIGLSGQMHGATVLDKDDNVLWPCMLWNDTRAHTQANAMDGDPAFRQISGNIVFPGFTAPKVDWLRVNHPALFDKIAKVLLPKDYLRLWLTGEYVSDMSDAAGTSWFDTGARDWSYTLLEKSHLTRDHMPKLVEGSLVSGTVRDDLAARFGMASGVVVAGGGGDNAASAIGVGVVRPGDAFVSLGTSGVLFATSKAYSPDADTAVHTFCHALPDTWHQMGVILAASDALTWYANLVGDDPAKLTGALDGISAPGKTLFLPYLGGERTPLNDPHIRGAFLGLEHATDRQAGTRAVLEGVSFALRDCKEALGKTGTQIDSLLAVGGGSQSATWLRILATTLNCAIDIPSGSELGGALGAARLGLMASTGANASIAIKPQLERCFEPDAALIDAFEEGYQRYRAAQIAVGGLS